MFGREPAVILGLVGALIALAVGFGLDVSAEQTGLIMAAVSAVLAFVTRSQVTPVDADGLPAEKRMFDERGVSDLGLIIAVLIGALAVGLILWSRLHS